VVKLDVIGTLVTLSEPARCAEARTPEVLESAIVAPEENSRAGWNGGIAGSI
jgi:hypothetical protein